MINLWRKVSRLLRGEQRLALVLFQLSGNHSHPQDGTHEGILRRLARAAHADAAGTLNAAREIVVPYISCDFDAVDENAHARRRIADARHGDVPPFAQSKLLG